MAQVVGSRLFWGVWQVGFFGRADTRFEKLLRVDFCDQMLIVV